MSKEVARIIRVIGTNEFVKDAEQVRTVGDEIILVDENDQPYVHVSLTSNPLEAKRFPADFTEAHDFIQTTPDSGFLTKAYSDPLIGGFNRYEVVALEIGAVIPPNR